MKKILLSLFVVFLTSLSTFALPYGHRYATEQANQNIVTDINTSFTVSVEWGEGDWTSSNFGYGLTTDGTGWTWVNLPWFQDGDGSNKRCKAIISISNPGKYYYAYRMVKSGVTSYSFGSDSWAENSSTLSAVSTLTIGEFTIASGNWSSNSTWNGNAVPSSSNNVGIYHDVTLDQNGDLKSLYIATGKTFTASDATSRILTIASGGSLTNNGTFISGSGTVVFTGSCSVTGTISFNNVEIGGGVNFGTGSTVNGVLQLNAGSYVNTNAPTYATGSTLRYNTGTDYSISSEWYADQTSGAGVPYNVDISSSTQVHFTGSQDHTMNGTFTIGSGKIFSLSTDFGADFFIKGDFINNGGTFNANSRLVTFNGTTEQEIQSDAAMSFAYLTIDNSAGVSINSNGLITVANNLTINNSRKLTINTGKSLTVTGALTNSAGNTGIVIKSDASGTGSLITANGVGATVERYISGAAEAWHLISSPVSGQAISDDWTPTGSYAGGLGYDFYAWDEPSATWLNQKVGANNITSFVPGKGYLVAFEATNPTKTFTGTLNSGNITLPVTVYGSTTFGYANLAGNPYSSSIDWKNNSGFTRSMLKDDDIGVGVGYSLYTWNQSENNYGAYISNSTSDEGTLGVSRYVSPMQGFFVVAASAGDFVINNYARVHSAQAWLKSGNDNSFRLKATAPANYGSDELLLEFGHESSNGGAEKWSSFVAEAPGIYTPKNGKNYSISFLNSVSENPVIPVSFTAGVQGNYTISADFNSDVFSQVSLRDNKTGDMQDMRINPVYSFSATPGDDDNRFSLHFSSVGIDETSDLKAMNAYFHDGLLYISNTPSNAQITLSILTGQVVMQRNAGGSGLVTLNAASLPKGVYIVTVQGEGARVSRKVVL